MGRKFIVRGVLLHPSESSYKQAREMLKGIGEDSQLITIKPSYEKASEINRLNLPKRLNVRFVRVLLSTGKYEVLVTNLLDEQLYPTEDFKELYHLRWRCETFYGILKTRLNLEHFSGKTVWGVAPPLNQFIKIFIQQYF
jgi:IS4 transposase